MKLLFLLCIFGVGVDVTLSQALVSNAESPEAADIYYDFPFHNRTAWGAAEPKGMIPLTTPVPYVVIHDSGEPPGIDLTGCFNFSKCSESMKNIQNLHMEANGWWDIGYNFAVGGDGAAYEGRGWDVQGSHAKYFNTISIGIVYIGSFNGKPPSLIQQFAANQLIAAGVLKGFLRPDYRLITHGQIKTTPCPGKKLIKKVQTQLHYSNFPRSLKDLLSIPELPDEIKAEIKNELAVLATAALAPGLL